jgi:hypothetical protein
VEQWRIDLIAEHEPNIVVRGHAHAGGLAGTIGNGTRLVRPGDRAGLLRLGVTCDPAIATIH